MKYGRSVLEVVGRRSFLQRSTGAIGAAALGSLLNSTTTVFASPGSSGNTTTTLPHFPPKAKRVIYLFQSGAPSQMELFDYKPKLRDYHGSELPESIRDGQRLTTMTAAQKAFPVAASKFSFAQYGETGAWVSELLPFTAKIIDKLCIIRSVFTEAINHDPAITFFQTGSQLAGRPSIGSWISYGLGTENEDLPCFIVMTSRGSGHPVGQPLYDRLWGAGFLPTIHQGVKFRAGADPVLYLSNPKGIDRLQRAELLDDLKSLNSVNYEVYGDPEILTRIKQYEMAFRMQASVPMLADVSDEPQHILDKYGPDVHRPGSYASNCLLARRLAERDVRFVQLYHMGWDQHTHLPKEIVGQCRDTDQPTAALIQDLEERGLLDDTLVVWGGEFGRTVYCQGELTAKTYGRDHHPRCFTIWMAGGGVKEALSFGRTDDYSYNIVEDPVHVHDINATILHLLGIDHTRLTYRFQGRDFRLTDVHGNLIAGIVA